MGPEIFPGLAELYARLHHNQDVYKRQPYFSLGWESFTGTVGKRGTLEPLRFSSGVLPCIDVSEDKIENGTASIFIEKELQRVKRDVFEKLNQRDVLFVLSLIHIYFLLSTIIINQEVSKKTGFAPLLVRFF